MIAVRRGVGRDNPTMKARPPALIWKGLERCSIAYITFRGPLLIRTKQDLRDGL